MVKAAPRPDWDGGPGFAEELRNTGDGRRRKAVFNACWRELIGAGARPLVGGEDGHWWTIVDLPLGGRLKVTGSKDSTTLARLWKDVRDRRERRRWGALVRPAIGIGGSPEVVMPLEEFAVLVGTLDRLMREKARQDAVDEHVDRAARR